MHTKTRTPAPKPTPRRRPELRWHAEYTLSPSGVTRRTIAAWTS